MATKDPRSYAARVADYEATKAQYPGIDIGPAPEADPSAFERVKQGAAKFGENLQKEKGRQALKEIRRADAPRDLPSVVAAADEEDDMETRRALGGVDPMAVAGGAAMAGGEYDARAQQIAELLAAGVHVPGYANPVRPVEEKFAGTMGQLMDQEFSQSQQLQSAQMNERQAHANAYAQEAGRMQAENDVMQMKAQRDAQRRIASVEAAQMIQTKVSEAADRLNATAEQGVDPNRYWASQSAGRKFAWGVQAALMGFAGLDPFGALNTAIERDIDAQKATFAQRAAGFDARQGELAGQRSVYQDLRDAIGDEQATDLAMRSARLQQADAMFRAMASKEGLGPAAIEGNIFLTQLQQKQAEITRALELKLATTPEMIGGGFKPLVGAGFQRKQLEGELKELRERGGKLQELAITQGGEASRQAAGIEGDIAKQAAKGQTPEGAKLEYTQRHNLTKDIEPFVNEARLIEKFQREYPNEIPGIAFGMRPTTITDDQKQAYSRLKRIVMVRLRRESGAAISDPELERDAEEILQAMDEDDVRNMLADRLDEAKARIDYFSRAPDEREVEVVNRAKVAPRAPLADGGVGMDDPIAYDED